MTQKTAAFVVLALLLGAGFLLGSFFGGALIGGYAASSSHRAIVDKIKVVDTTKNLELTPKFVCSKSVTYAKGLSLFFIPEKDYTFSTWLWQRYDDTELAMTIWGPDESGTHFSLEFGRLGSNLKVTFDGVEKFTVPACPPSMPAEGLYWFEVEVP
jgi:hypothetical protein